MQAHPVWWSLVGTENEHLINNEDTFVTVARAWTRTGAAEIRLRLTAEAFTKGSTLRFVVRKKGSDGH